MFLMLNQTFHGVFLLFCKTVKNTTRMTGDKKTTPSRLSGLIKTWTERARNFWTYCTTGVWSDTRRNWKVNTIKTLNLSAQSFMNSELQNRASMLTYNTLLAIVPALALLFAIGRGFGFQNLLKSQLFTFFPSQREVLETAIGFVDHYLAQASQGIFVGVGLVFLLWTMISLMSNIEDSFNKVWGVKSNRPMARKVIDYTAIMFLLPILMVCSSGISLLMSTTIVDNPHFKIFSPAVKVLLDLAPFFLTWLSFTGMYMLFPNPKVKFKHALYCGTLAGTAFQILQYLFVSGQIYVSKYNAIYGSFAFLPLLLIWLQLVWSITLAGAVLCYSSQNIFQFNFSNDINAISLDYKRKIAVVIMTIIVKRFSQRLQPLTIMDFAALYHMPSRIVTDLIREMADAGLLSIVYSENEKEQHAYQPAVDIHEITLGFVLDKLNSQGTEDFIPNFQEEFAPIINEVENSIQSTIKNGSEVVLMDIAVDISGTPSTRHK